jgi:WD40 repeat protein
LNGKQYLVSVSEDSTMKIWNIEKVREKIDCITTIREHSGPIFTAVEGEGYLFTGGM